MVTIRKPVGCSGFELNRKPDNREFYVSHSRGTPANAGAPLIFVSCRMQLPALPNRSDRSAADRVFP